MITYDQAKQLPVIAVCSRPDGYFGERANVSIAIHDGAILEIHQCGVYRCPAVMSATDAREVDWLINHHPNFRQYKRII